MNSKEFSDGFVPDGDGCIERQKSRDPEEIQDPKKGHERTDSCGSKSVPVARREEPGESNAHEDRLDRVADDHGEDDADHASLGGLTDRRSAARRP